MESSSQAAPRICAPARQAQRTAAVHVEAARAMHSYAAADHQPWALRLHGAAPLTSGSKCTGAVGTRAAPHEAMPCCPPPCAPAMHPATPAPQPFFDTVQQLVDLTIAANDKGNYFPVGQQIPHCLAMLAVGMSRRRCSAAAAATQPRSYAGNPPLCPCTPPSLPPALPPPCLPQLHGVCLGMEALAVAVSRNHSILADFDAENLPSPLFLTGGWTCIKPACLPALGRGGQAAVWPAGVPCPLCCCSPGSSWLGPQPVAVATVPPGLPSSRPACINSAEHLHFNVPPPQTLRRRGAAASSARCRPRWWSTCRRGPTPWRTTRMVSQALAICACLGPFMWLAAGGTAVRHGEPRTRWGSLPVEVLETFRVSVQRQCWRWAVAAAARELPHHPTT